LLQILGIWAAAAIPTVLLAWGITPTLVADPQNPGFMRVSTITMGLIWQFVLVSILLYREAGNLRWSTLKARLWLGAPRSISMRMGRSGPSASKPRFPGHAR
jgi:hypothetical protein